MVIRLGRNGRFLACSLYPEHKESRPLPGEEPELAALAGVGEPCPTCGETDGGVLAVKRGRFGPFVGCNRYPECAYIKKDGPPPPEQLPVHGGLPALWRGTPRGAPGSPDRLRLLGLLALPEMRLHELARTARARPRRGRRDRSPGATRRAVSASSAAHACRCRAASCRSRGRRSRAARPIRRRWRGPAAGADDGQPEGRLAHVRAARPRAGAREPGHRVDGRREPAAPPRARRPAPTEPGVDDPPPLDRFLASLAARDASPHTQRAYRTAVGAYLEWLATAGVGWRAPSQDGPARISRGAG